MSEFLIYIAICVGPSRHNHTSPGSVKWMADGGFEVVDIPFDKSAAFIKERSKDYMEAAKSMGLVK